MNIESPNILVILHLQIAIVMMMAKSIAKSMSTEQNMPWASTVMVFPIAIAIIHGMGSLKQNFVTLEYDFFTRIG